MELTSSDIEYINSNCPNSEQGIYTQPFGIPVDVKEPVIYMRHETGGWRGGGYGEFDTAKPYENEEPKPKFKVLDLTLNRLVPKLTYLQYRQVEELIHTNNETEREYYGNSTDYEIQYIVLSELYKLLETFE